MSKDNSPLMRGLTGHCPACGEGALFSGFLTYAKSCNFCGQSFEMEDAGDGPAFFIIVIVGLIVVFPALFVQLAFAPPIWLQALIWLPVTSVLVLLLLRPFRGLWFGVMYKHDAGQAELEDGDQ